jgi:hypothetical protein
MKVTISHEIEVDDCVADEILILNGMGIQTLYCCCGHGERRHAFIMTKTDHYEEMERMGYVVKKPKIIHVVYRQYPKSRVYGHECSRKTFLPKSKCYCRNKVEGQI